MYQIMGGGNVYMWHDHMNVHYTLVVKWHICNSFKIFVTCNYNAISEKNQT
jgi:hypothetical protein